MTTIEKNKGIVSLIGICIFNVEFSKQQKLVNMIVVSTKQIMSKQVGFISANIHKSLDSTKVVNYTQGENKEGFEKMMNNPKTQIHFNDISNIAKSTDGTI